MYKREKREKHLKKTRKKKERGKEREKEPEGSSYLFLCPPFVTLFSSLFCISI